MPTCHLYPFKFNRAWLLKKYLGDIVNSSWETEVHSSFDPMSALTYKLKRLKGSVKDWEKRMVLEKAKETIEIDFSIHNLLSSRISGILTEVKLLISLS